MHFLIMSHNSQYLIPNTFGGWMRETPHQFCVCWLTSHTHSIRQNGMSSLSQKENPKREGFQGANAHEKINLIFGRERG